MTVENDMRQRRDRETERSAGRKMPAPFEVKVVGVSFTPHYPNNLHTLLDATVVASVAGEPLAVVLRRNPDNQYDSNAIEVHVPALGDLGFVGHLTRPIAARIAPEMDDGQQWTAEVVSVLVDPDHQDRPGISIKCDRAPEQEQQ